MNKPSKSGLMITANARATFGPGEPFQATTIDRRNLGPLDVLIAIQYTGICHSDIHYARSDFGPQDYPLIPGHEIAGIVTEVGQEVTKYSGGDRVGVGCMVDAYLSLLALDGVLVNLGVPAEPLSLNVFSLIPHRRSFAASLIGGIRETQEMLDFCAEHKIGPEIEVISADRIDEAFERVLASDVRYRFVIDISTMANV